MLSYPLVNDACCYKWHTLIQHTIIGTPGMQGGDVERDAQQHDVVQSSALYYLLVVSCSNERIDQNNYSHGTLCDPGSSKYNPQQPPSSARNDAHIFQDTHICITQTT